ncbi:MAG TPA: 2'-deoxycytidine 5'-triphosphate deaminase [Dehalococcoidia bacterium]|nr:2'-deoxycytidine 5'-triphosphate deaminase [Dehalococcoidia bacterium]
MADGEGLDLFPELKRELRSYGRGVLPYQEIKALVAAGRIGGAEPVDEAQLQPASIDLRLGEVAYQVRASFLPGARGRVLDALPELLIQQIDLRCGAVLQRGAVYVVPLLEALQLPPSVQAKANPKSSTGRLDVLARLIADYAEQFDRVPRGYHGPLYVELAPRTFNVRVRTGTKLNQVRFLRGVAPNADVSRKAAGAGEELVYGEDGEPQRASVLSGLWFSVDLKGGDSQIIGWKAIHDAPVIDADRTGCYDPADFWEPVRRLPEGALILKPGEFYILGSKERVRVPHAFAAEMVPYDPSVGEFRVHYAGFFDPGFGYGRGELRGTRAILEVRSHEVPYALRDGQKIGRLIYERLLAPPEKLYGTSAGSSYQFQRLGLSKHFRLPEHCA